MQVCTIIPVADEKILAFIILPFEQDKVEERSLNSQNLYIKIIPEKEQAVVTALSASEEKCKLSPTSRRQQQQPTVMVWHGMVLVKIDTKPNWLALVSFSEHY